MGRLYKVMDSLWLTPVANGEAAGGWTLFEFHKGQ